MAARVFINSPAGFLFAERGGVELGKAFADGIGQLVFFRGPQSVVEGRFHQQRIQNLAVRRAADGKEIGLERHFNFGCGAHAAPPAI